jgi:predicted nucleotidyltransferase
MILTFILLALTAASSIECGRRRQLVDEAVDQALFNRAQVALSRLTPETASETLKEMVAAKDDK